MARMPLAAAHEVASRLEEAMRDELGPDVEVETHIEPLPADVLPGSDASPARIAEVREVSDRACRRNPRPRRGARRARARNRDGEIVNFHCSVDPALSVSAVHDMVDSAGAPAAPAISRHPARHRPRRAAASNLDSLRLSIRAQSFYITGHHAHRRTPPRPPPGLPPARLADRNRRSRRVAASDRDDGSRQAQAQAQPRRHAGAARARRRGAEAALARARRQAAAGGEFRRHAGPAHHRAAAEPRRSSSRSRPSSIRPTIPSSWGFTAPARPIARNARPKGFAASPIFSTGPT